jgi:hypothetical protein
MPRVLLKLRGKATEPYPRYVNVSTESVVI